MKRSTTQAALLPAAPIIGQRLVLLLLLGMLALFALVGASVGHARSASTPTWGHVAATNGDIHINTIAGTNGDIHIGG